MPTGDRRERHGNILGNPPRLIAKAEEATQFLQHILDRPAAQPLRFLEKKGSGLAGGQHLEGPRLAHRRDPALHKSLSRTKMLANGPRGEISTLGEETFILF
jgi:hypothetical protein